MALEPSGVDGDVRASAHTLSSGKRERGFQLDTEDPKGHLLALPVPSHPAGRARGSTGPGGLEGWNKDRGLPRDWGAAKPPGGRRTQPVLGRERQVSGRGPWSWCLHPWAPRANKGFGLPACAPTPGSLISHRGVGAPCADAWCLRPASARCGRHRPGRCVYTPVSASRSSAQVIPRRPWTHSPTQEPRRQDPPGESSPRPSPCSFGARPLRGACGAPARHRVSLWLSPVATAPGEALEREHRRELQGPHSRPEQDKLQVRIPTPDGMKREPQGVVWGDQVCAAGGQLDGQPASLHLQGHAGPGEALGRVAPEPPALVLRPRISAGCWWRGGSCLPPPLSRPLGPPHPSSRPPSLSPCPAPTAPQ